MTHENRDSPDSSKPPKTYEFRKRKKAYGNCAICGNHSKRIAIANVCQVCYMDTISNANVGCWRYRKKNTTFHSPEKKRLALGISGAISQEDRGVSLGIMGICSYQNYLVLEIWRRLRDRAMKEHDGFCFACGMPAKDVHHARYDIETMRNGGHLLWPVCRECHATAELDENGRPRGTVFANTMLLQRRATGSFSPDLIRENGSKKKPNKPKKTRNLKAARRWHDAWLHDSGPVEKPPPPKATFYPARTPPVPMVAPLNRRPAAVERAMGVRPSWLEPPQ